MGKVDEIREAFLRLAATVGPKPTLQGVVVSVDETEMTAAIQDSDGNDLPPVRLRNVLDGKESTTIYPKVGTWVIAVRIEHDDEWILIAAGEIYKWRLYINEDINIEVGAAGVVFNGGALGGMVKIGDLISKLNAVEQQLNSLKTVFTTWVPVPSDGGAALKTAVASWAGNNITLTVAGDLENNNVKQ